MAGFELTTEDWRAPVRTAERVMSVYRPARGAEEESIGESFL